MKLSALSTAFVLVASVICAFVPGLARGPAPVPRDGAMSTCVSGADKVVRARDCEAKGDGATSDRDALERCVTAAARTAGGVCLLDAGTFVIDSDHDQAISIANGVTLKGQGPEATTIKVSGRSQLNQVLTFDNPSNDWVEDLTLRGNSVNSCAGCGGLVAFVGTEAAARPMTAFGLKNIGVENDRHDYWIYILNNSALPMRGITIDHLRARSFPNNCRDPKLMGVPCDMVSFRGQTESPGGTIERVMVTAPVADGSYVKCFAIFWDGVFGARVVGGRLENFGEHVDNDVTAYAITAYFMDTLKGRGTPPSHIWVTNNSIIRPRTAGVYSAIARDVHVDNNRISGQYDPTDQTLLHGAIAFNNTSGEASGNQLTNNLYGIEAAPGGPIREGVQLTRNMIESDVADGKGIAIVGQSPPADIQLSGNTVRESGKGSFGIFLRGSERTPLGNVWIEGGSIAARYTNVFLYDATGGAPAAASIRVNGVTLAGRPTGSAFAVAGCTTVPLALSQVTFEGADYDGANGLNIQNCTNVTLEGVVFRNLTGRSRSLVTDGAHIQEGGTQFVNVGPENR